MESANWAFDALSLMLYLDGKIAGKVGTKINIHQVFIGMLHFETMGSHLNILAFG